MIKLYPEIKDRVWSTLLILYSFSRKRCTWYSIMMTSQSLQLTDSGRIVEFTDQLFSKRASQSILHATPTSRLTLPETIVVPYYHQSHLICWSSISYFFFFFFFFDTVMTGPTSCASTNSMRYLPPPTNIRY